MYNPFLRLIPLLQAVLVVSTDAYGSNLIHEIVVGLRENIIRVFLLAFMLIVVLATGKRTTTGEPLNQQKSRPTSLPELRCVVHEIVAKPLTFRISLLNTSHLPLRFSRFDVGAMMLGCKLTDSIGDSLTIRALKIVRVGPPPYMHDFRIVAKGNTPLRLTIDELDVFWVLMRQDGQEIQTAESGEADFSIACYEIKDTIRICNAEFKEFGRAAVVGSGIAILR